MIDWLNTIDTQVFLALNGLHAPYFDAFIKLFTGKWIWVPMYAAVLFAVVRNYRWRQTLAVLVCVALAITIADQVCATLIRPEVCRLRPSNPANPLSEMVHIVGGYRGGSYGFPSCHAANSFALASFLTLLFANRKLSLFIFAWAVLNSFARLSWSALSRRFACRSNYRHCGGLGNGICRRLCGRPSGQTASEAECQHRCGHIGWGVDHSGDSRGFMFRENVTELLPE